MYIPLFMSFKSSMSRVNLYCSKIFYLTSFDRTSKKCAIEHGLRMVLPSCGTAIAQHNDIDVYEKY